VNQPETFERRIADRMRQAAERSFIGREAELERLEELLFEDGRSVVFVHGIGGIGKTALLRALETRLAANGTTVMRSLGQDLEPTPRGVLTALAAALGIEAVSVSAVVSELDRAGARDVVWCVDDYDTLRLVDTWMRQTLLPSFPGSARVVFAGRSRPLTAWTSALEWDGLVGALELGPLAAKDAEELLLAESVAPERISELRRVTGDHPLALRLAAAALASRPHPAAAEPDSRWMVGELVDRLLADVRDPALVQAVEASSLVRRVTRPLLAALLETGDAASLAEALARLPFVEVTAGGLRLDETVRRAVNERLRALDPTLHRRLRRRAYRALEPEIRAARGAGSWRAMADALYLVEQPAVREAFFPSERLEHAVERARPVERELVLGAVRAHAGAAEAAALAHWWDALPRSFHVVRGADDTVLGFYALAFASEIPAAVRDTDPVVARWLGDAARRSPDGARPVLLNRITLSTAAGERPSPERASAFLDLKRWYLENPDLAGLYASMHDLDELPLLEKLGFRLLDDSSNEGVGSILLEFGGGVGEWLSRLLELESRDPTPEAAGAELELDDRTRELVVGGERRRLTRLEYGVLSQLFRSPGAVVTRDELLAEVWGQAHTGSNVVDVVVRSLRKKLEPHARRLETVTGFGYKLVL